MWITCCLIALILADPQQIEENKIYCTVPDYIVSDIEASMNIKLIDAKEANDIALDIIENRKYASQLLDKIAKNIMDNSKNGIRYTTIPQNDFRCDVVRDIVLTILIEKYGYQVDIQDTNVEIYWIRN